MSLKRSIVTEFSFGRRCLSILTKRVNKVFNLRWCTEDLDFTLVCNPEFGGIHEWVFNALISQSPFNLRVGLSCILELRAKIREEMDAPTVEVDFLSLSRELKDFLSLSKVEEFHHNYPRSCSVRQSVSRSVRSLDCRRRREVFCAEGFR